MSELNREYLIRNYKTHRLNELTEIYVIGNKITKIVSNTFNGLSRLLILRLDNNGIGELNGKIFENLSGLRELGLSNNKLRRIVANAFKGLVRLEKLSLEDNIISEIDEKGLNGLSNLRNLQLFNNKLKRLDQNTFQGLENLEELSLKHNELAEIDEKLFSNLTSLTILLLNNNKIKGIEPKTFDNNKALKTLSLENNGITELDGYIFENLTNLKLLYLNNNNLKRIDSHVFIGLKNLEILYLNNNKIEAIDSNGFESLSNLDELLLNDNRLKRLNAATLKGLWKLKRLSLSYNQIEEIDGKSFENLSNLNELWLNDNKIKAISSSMFKGTDINGSLYLNGNEIEEIDAKSFEHLARLQILKLNNNKLKEIDRRCFEPLKSIQVIELYENDSGLNVLSFLNRASKLDYWEYDKDKLSKYGFKVDWGEFLKQLSEIDQNIEDLYIGKIFSDRYEVLKRLGKGTFGTVYLVNDKYIDDKKAMKIMNRFDSATENELKLFWEISHENILKYFHDFHKRIGDDSHTFLITEYCENGDMKKQIEHVKKLNMQFDEVQILKWIYQVTDALKYLHSMKPPVIHRDIKPANILLTSRNHIKIADLGVAKLMDNTHASSYAGTEQYMSPEVFKARGGNVKYYPNTDIWSLGCVLYELVYLERAFPQGQRGDPPLPVNLANCGLFSFVLPKMLEKVCLARITSIVLMNELEKLFPHS